MIKLIFISSLFFIAGIAHLRTPENFYSVIPDFFVFKREITVITGYLELILVLALLWKRSRDLAAKTTASYLLLLVPIHVYMAVSGIEILGVSNPLILWVRTVFQFVLIYWTLSLQKNFWIIQQDWKDVVFLHYKIAPEKIQDLVPFPLDLYHGEAILSIVPFQMCGIRFPFIPALPIFSSLWELNLRTYVTVNGVRGVYFFSLDTDSWMGEKIARSIFHLPYFYSKIRAKILFQSYEFEHERLTFGFSLKARSTGKVVSDAFHLWASERYHLFTRDGTKSYQGTVQHDPWVLEEIEIIDLNNRLTASIGLEIHGMPFASSYGRQLRVRFQPFKKIKS